MSRHVESITLDNLEDLPRHCRRCVYWELSPHVREQAEQYGETEFEKEVWVSSVLLEWGSCGRIGYSEGLPTGFVLYAPPNAVPRAGAFPTSPPSVDAVLLTAFHVQPELRRNGLGRGLVQAVVADLTRRGVQAVEAFGDTGVSTAETGATNPEHSCVVPAAFLRSVGFKTVRKHEKWPRLRLELRSGMAWQADVEAALERMLGQVPVGAGSASSSDEFGRG